MGKASRKKKKAIREGQANESGNSKSSKDSVVVLQAKKKFEKPASRVTFLLIIIVILLSSFAVYFNSLSNGFVYDDRFQVLENKWITDIKYIPEIFSKNVWGFRQRFSSTNYYRPMMHLIYMMNYHMFGLKPWGFHLVNVLFHAGVSIIVFLITLRLLKELPSSVSVSSLAPPFIAALLFATHPIHTEAVTWVAGLTDLSFTFFYLLSFYFYVISRGGNLAIKDTYLLSVGSFFLATLCKETALTLPLILVAYDYAFRKKEVRLTFTLKKYIPYLLIAGVYFILRFHALGQFAPQKRHPELHTYQYLINIFPLFMQYLEKLILPLNLNAFHVLHPISSLFEAKAILSLIITVAFVVLNLIAFKKNKVIFVSLVFIVIPLMPVLYIPGLGENTFTERYLYLSSFGFVLILASLIQWSKKKKPAVVTIFLTSTFVLVAGFYSWGTVSRNIIWKDNFTLFADTVRKSPDAKEPHNDLGAALLDKGQIDKAIEEFQSASTLNPNFVDPHYNLGLSFFKKGWIDKAIEQYQIAIKLDPDLPAAHNNLGLAFLKKGWVDKAVEQFQISLGLEPDYVDAHINLGLALFNKGLTDRAIEHYQIALRLNTNSAEAHSNLGLAFFNKGFTDKAVEQFQIALRLNPNLAVAHNGLGAAFYNKGRIDDATEQFQIAVKLDPDFADAHNNLGVIYKKSGAIDEAIDEYQVAVRLNPSHSAYRDNLARAYELKRLKRLGR